MSKKNRQKLHIVLSYKDRLKVALAFFKRLLLDPQKEMQEFLPLCEFVLSYDKCFVFELTQSFEYVFTKNEIEAKTFINFENVFKQRVMLDTGLDLWKQKNNSSVFRSLGFKFASFFVSNVFLLFNSSVFGLFSRNTLKEKYFEFLKLNQSFFEALKCNDYTLEKKN